MEDITRILQNWSQESSQVRGYVVASLYEELRRNAVAHLRKERHGDLQPTSLVNEAYMRLINIKRIDLTGRQHFMGLAGRIMREILVDEARKLRAAKRDQALQTRFTGEHVGGELPVCDLLELDQVLTGLEKIDPVYVHLFEARAFAGMTIEEAAEVLEISPATVKRKWKIVMAWVREHLEDDAKDR